MNLQSVCVCVRVLGRAGWTRANNESVLAVSKQKFLSPAPAEENCYLEPLAYKMKDPDVF